METSQAPEASAQPMETSQAAPALQEDVAGPSEPGAVPAACPHKMSSHDAQQRQTWGT